MAKIIINGQKTVATAGTAEALSTSTRVRSITIKSLPTNTGNVFVGTSTVNSSNGYILGLGEGVDLDVDDLAAIFIDSAVDGDGVSFTGID